LPEGRIFKNPVLNAVDRVTSLGLELGDRPFYQGNYEKYLTQQMKLNKVDVPTQEMIDAAKSYAEERTFQNVSELVKGLQYAKKAVNKVFAAMGIGSSDVGVGDVVLPFVKTPANILEAVDRGVDFFDCVYPTRNGRHGHAYTNEGKLNLLNAKYELDDRPIEEGCCCPACNTYSRAYIRHLLKAKEMLGMRLLVLHNLYFYNHMMEEIREAIRDKRYKEYKKKKL
jgi:predicted RNA-binding protein